MFSHLAIGVIILLGIIFFDTINSIIKQDALFENISDGTFFYFLHSYGLEKLHPNNTICQTEYGNKFVSAFNKKNIYGIQFHPEKSHLQGEQLLLNFYRN